MGGETTIKPLVSGGRAQTKVKMTSTNDKGGGGGGSSDKDHWCEDWILASLDSWVCSGRPKDDVVGKVMTSFGLKELRESARRFQKGNWITPNLTVIGENTPGYSRKLAEDMYDAMVVLQNLEVSPVSFFVSASNLAKVPGAAFVDSLDEEAVSVRLGGVDGKLAEILERLAKTEHLAGTVTGLATSVTQLQEQLRQQRVPPAQPIGSWAELAGRNRSRVRQLNAGERPRSASTKRVGEETHGATQKQLRLATASQEMRSQVEVALAARAAHPENGGSALSQDLFRERNFQEVRYRRKGSNVKKGSSEVQAEGAEAAPFSVFISRTSPACKVETVKEKLVQCAAAVRAKQPESEMKELEFVKVEEILVKIPEGEERRSRCWKVTVQPEFADYMMTGEAYPAAWGFRKWQRGPTRPALPLPQGHGNGDGGA